MTKPAFPSGEYSDGRSVWFCAERTYADGRSHIVCNGQYGPSQGYLTCADRQTFALWGWHPINDIVERDR